MITRGTALNRIVRVKTKSKDQLGLFQCSSIAVGAGMAGQFLDDGEGNVIPLANMIEVVDETEAYNELRQWKAGRDRARIKEVIVDVDDAQKEFEGTIVLHVGFKGSLAKTKALTKAERLVLESALPAQGEDEKAKAERKALIAKLKQNKPLFESEEYDAIEAFKNARRTEFANLGIPFPLGDSMYLIRIKNIPKAEELSARTEVELGSLVEALEAAYPAQITAEATGLGPLYNAGDYRAPEAISSLFKFKHKWMHFGVPEVLKEIDVELWEQERERTAAVWQEAKEQGLILLRETMALMVKRLVEAVTPDAEGKKKRFYATAVTSLTDFFETFEDRNLAGDEELSSAIALMRQLVEGHDIEEFKTDDALRASVQKAGSKIQEQLESMLVESGERRISFTD